MHLEGRAQELLPRSYFETNGDFSAYRAYKNGAQVVEIGMAEIVSGLLHAGGGEVVILEIAAGCELGSRLSYCQVPFIVSGVYSAYD